MKNVISAAAEQQSGHHRSDRADRVATTPPVQMSVADEPTLAKLRDVGHVRKWESNGARQDPRRTAEAWHSRERHQPPLIPRNQDVERGKGPTPVEGCDYQGCPQKEGPD